MKRMMNDAEARLRAKLAELPDGTWGRSPTRTVAEPATGRLQDRCWP